MDAQRQFSEKEVAVILRDAIAMQRGSATPGPGTTLAELREIATEIGLDPDLIDVAALRAAAAPHGPAERLLGGGVHRETTIVREGAMSTGEVQALARRIREAMHHQGTTREVLGAMEWSSVGQPSQVSVTATTGEDRTTVQVVADRSAAASLTLVGGIGAGVFAGAVTGAILEPGLLGGLAVMGTGVAAGIGIARGIWAQTSRRFQHRLNRLLVAIRQAPEG